MKCPKCEKKLERLELQNALGARGVFESLEKLRYLCESCGLIFTKNFKDGGKL